MNQEKENDSPDHHSNLRYTNLANGNIDRLQHQQTEYQYSARAGDKPLRQGVSPLSDDGAGFDIPGYPDFSSRRPHRTNPPPQLPRTADQNLHSLVRESVENDNLYEADGETSASTDPESYSSVAGPPLPLSTPVPGRIRRDTDEGLKQSSDDGSESGYVAGFAAGHQDGRDEGYTEGFAAAHRSRRGQGYFVGQTDERGDAIILALRLQIERQEAELVRFRNEAVEAGAYTGREVARHQGLEGRQEQWEENQEIIDEQSDQSDTVYDQGFTEGQAEARRARGLAIQAAYRAGYMDRGGEMLGFIHKTAGREPLEYREENDDWP